MTAIWAIPRERQARALQERKLLLDYLIRAEALSTTENFTEHFRACFPHIIGQPADVLRAGDSVQRAFVTLAPTALDALAVDRVSLWERTDGDRLDPLSGNAALNAIPVTVGPV